MVDPNHPIARDAALSSRNVSDRRAAARGVLDDPRANTELVRKSVEVLSSLGDRIVLGPLGYGDWLFGWVCWKAKTPIKLTLKPDGGTAHEVKPIVVELDADVFHPLADLLGCAATFNLERPKNGRWRLEVSASDITLNVPVREPDTSQVWSSVPVRSGPRVNEVTVIVPIYDNALSTMSCLGAVRRQRSLGLPYRTIVVNDASPNVSLVEAVRKRAADREFELIENNVNLGFVESVNRALDACPDTDVLLLNADAFLPAQTISRLSAAANSDESIGIVVPFSNDAEFTSFPVPNLANPLERYSRRAEIDTVMRASAGSEVADLRIGTAFCMYITAACRGATGRLSNLYLRGYGEDGDYCALARERGFRTVCAAGVYVGHAGGQSFKREKRALVLRNRRVVAGRFPEEHAAAVAFSRLDPLKRIRADIEINLPISGRVDLFVAPAGQSAIIDLAVGSAFENGSTVPVILEWLRSAGRLVVTVKGRRAALPQSLRFCLDDADDRLALKNYLDRLAVERMILVDHVAIHPGLLDAVAGVTAARVALVTRGPRLRATMIAHGDTCVSTRARPCRKCVATWRSVRRDIAARLPAADVSEIVATDPDGLSVCQLRAAQPVPARVIDAPADNAAVSKNPDRAGRCLALLAPEASLITDRLAIAIGRALAQAQIDLPVILLGACVSDRAVMASRRVFVVGSVEEREYPAVMQNYDVGALFLLDRSGFVWMGKQIADRDALPFGRFGWPMYSPHHAVACTDSPTPLVLDAILCDRAAAHAVVHWAHALLSPVAS